VIPVAVALMTPVPLLIALIIKKCFGKKEEIIENPDPGTESMLKNKDCEDTIETLDSENENEQT